MMYKSLGEEAQAIATQIIPPNSLTECFKAAHAKRQNRQMSAKQREVTNNGVLKPLMAKLVDFVEKIHQAMVFLTFSRPPGAFKLAMDSCL